MGFALVSEDPAPLYPASLQRKPILLAVPAKAGYFNFLWSRGDYGDGDGSDVRLIIRHYAKFETIPLEQQRGK